MMNGKQVVIDASPNAMPSSSSSLSSSPADTAKSSGRSIFKP